MRAPADRRRLRDGYRDGLLHDTIPFWFPRSVDEEHGGFLTCFDRDGSLLQTDKSVWFQGRFSWMLATLYNTVERREDWLRLARHGLDFIRERCFDTDGRMFFSLTREGRPLRKRRYVFSEVFADRAYLPNGRLVPRSRPGALITDPASAAAKALRIVRDHVVTSVEGTEVPLEADTLCLHSDTPNALNIARAIHAALNRG